MLHLLDRTIREVTKGAVFELLPDETQVAISALSPETVGIAARNGLIRPQPGDASQSGRLLLNPCLAIQWLSAFEELNLPRKLRVYEPCTGSSEPVILAAEIYSG